MAISKFVIKYIGLIMPVARVGSTNGCRNLKAKHLKNGADFLGMGTQFMK